MSQTCTACEPYKHRARTACSPDGQCGDQIRDLLKVFIEIEFINKSIKKKFRFCKSQKNQHFTICGVIWEYHQFLEILQIHIQQAIFHIIVKGYSIVNQLVKTKKHKRPQSNFILNFLLLEEDLIQKERVRRMKIQPRITRHLPFFSTSL